MSDIDRGKLEAAIGPNAEYYVGQFERIDLGRSRATWNWPAFFLSTAWFSYRGMSGYAVLNFFAPWLALFLVGFAGALAPALSMAMLIAYPVLAFLVLPMYANALYYGHVRKAIGRASVSGKPVQPPAGGQMVSASILGTLAILLPAGLFYVAQVSYVDYIPRSQVSEAITLMNVAKFPIAEYYADNGKWPDGLKQVAVGTSGKYTERLEITRGAGAASGSLTITATMKAAGVNSSVSGKTVQLSTEDGKSWVCLRGAVNGVEDKYLPAACRNH